MTDCCMFLQVISTIKIILITGTDALEWEGLYLNISGWTVHMLHVHYIDFFPQLVV